MSPDGTFPAARGRVVIDALIDTVDTNAEWLSEIDGAIGDGDHGVNMRKGFLLVRDGLAGDIGLSAGLELIGDTLMTRIGGAMGPLYGSIFMEMGETCAETEQIDTATLAAMLEAGRAAVEELGEASVGDKTLLDTLAPATEAARAAADGGASLDAALTAMAAAAEAGKDSTIDLVARVGRASRLGERSRGVLDAGATSCWLLLSAMAASVKVVLAEAE